MGRSKIDTNCKLPIAKINSTFTKRKRGVVNKAKQLGKLCDVDVALIAFNPRNDAVIAVSHGGRVDDIINKYHNFKEHHLDKVEFIEELRPRPALQLQAHQMHPNTRVSLPMFEMERGMLVDQQQGFDIQTQGNNSCQNDQQQGFDIQAQGNNGHQTGQQQGFDIQAQGNNGHQNGQQQGFDIQAQGNNGRQNGQQQGFDIQAQGNNGRQNGQQQLLPHQLLPLAPPSSNLQQDLQHNNYGQ